MRLKLVGMFMSAVMALSSVSCLSAEAYSRWGDFEYDNHINVAHDGTVDWSLWDNFIKYDLKITDYDELTDKEKELCKFIYETEMVSEENIVCERARRILAGYDVGRRITLEDCQKYEAIGDYNSLFEHITYGYNPFSEEYIDTYYSESVMMECVPDIRCIGMNPYNCFWLDDEGKECIYTDDERLNIMDEGTESFYEGYTYVNNETGDQKIFEFNDIELDSIEKDGVIYLIYPDDTLAVSQVDEQMKDVVIPETVQGMPVTRVKSNAFKDSEAVNISLPETMKYIERIAFNNCQSLENINLPASLDYIGTFAFVYCKSLNDIVVDCPNLYFGSEDIFYYCSIKSLTINTKSAPYFIHGEYENVFFGNNVREIDQCYLNGKYDIPENVKVVFSPIHSFAQSWYMEYVKVPESIEIFGSYPSMRRYEAYNCSGMWNETYVPLLDENYCTVVGNCVIEGYYNSDAYDYAVEHGLDFKILDDVVYGDVNSDAQVSISDVVAIQRFLTKSMDLNAYQMKSADVNCDGNVNVFDCVLLKRELLDY